MSMFFKKMNKLKLLRKKVKKSNLKNFKEVKVKSVSLKKPLGFEKKRTFYFKEFNVLRKKNKFVLLNQKIVKNNIKNFKRLSNIIIFNKLSTKKKFKKLYNLHTLYNQNIKGKVFTRFNRKKYLRPFFVGKHNKRILKFFEKNPRR